MSATRDLSLPALLPAIYALRDAEQGGALADLLSVIGEQVAVVGQNIDQLYDDLFIETCQPWVVPYLGDLVDVRPVVKADGDQSPDRQRRASRWLFPRREVADTIAFERRKGTLAVLEDLAQAVASWPARAVEYYAQVNTFQASRHLDPEMGRTVSARDRDAIAREGTPFNTLAHLIDSRTLKKPSHRMFADHALFHTQHVGLLIWRLSLYSVTRGTARCLCSHPVKQVEQLRLYSLDSYGLTTPLAIKPAEELDDTSIAEEFQVPGPLTLRAFTDKEGRASDQYYGPDKSVAIWAQWGRCRPRLIPVERIVPTNLAWLLDQCCGGEKRERPCRQELTHQLVALLSTGDKEPDCTSAIRVAVDPERGLVAVVGKDLSHLFLQVSYHYNFSADLGGSEYDRPRTPQSYSANTRLHRLRSPNVGNRPIVLSLAGSDIGQFKDRCYRVIANSTVSRTASAISPRVIEIADSATYALGAKRITIEPGAHLEIRAAPHCRPTIDLCHARACEPALIVEMGRNSRLTLAGLRLAGGQIVFVDSPRGPSPPAPMPCGCHQPPLGEPLDLPPHVDIRHSTLLPGAERDGRCCGRSRPVGLDFRIEEGRLALDHSILGSLRITLENPQLPARVSIDDCIVDGQAADCEVAIAGSATLRIARSTVIGRTRIQEFDVAADTIFTADVEVQREQRGGMRFCYVPPSEIRADKPLWRTPQQYYCQPSQSFERSQLSGCNRIDGQAQATPWQLMEPQFTSLSFGDPGYCQLALECPLQISQGAEDGAEMGAFHDLYQPQRAAALQRRLEEFTPLSLQASLLFVT